jgi:hypothetical protein
VPCPDPPRLPDTGRHREDPLGHELGVARAADDERPFGCLRGRQCGAPCPIHPQPTLLVARNERVRRNCLHNVTTSSAGVALIDARGTPSWSLRHGRQPSSRPPNCRQTLTQCRPPQVPFHAGDPDGVRPPPARSFVTFGSVCDPRTHFDTGCSGHPIMMSRCTFGATLMPSLCAICASVIRSAVQRRIVRPTSDSSESWRDGNCLT